MLYIEHPKLTVLIQVDMKTTFDLVCRSVCVTKQILTLLIQSWCTFSLRCVCAMFVRWRVEAQGHWSLSVRRWCRLACVCVCVHTVICHCKCSFVTGSCLRRLQMRTMIQQSRSTTQWKMRDGRNLASAYIVTLSVCLSVSLSCLICLQACIFHHPWLFFQKHVKTYLFCILFLLKCFSFSSFVVGVGCSSLAVLDIKLL